MRYRVIETGDAGAPRRIHHVYAPCVSEAEVIAKAKWPNCKIGLSPLNEQPEILNILDLDDSHAAVRVSKIY